MKQFFSRPVLWISVLIIAGFAVWNVAKPDQDFSSMEKRYLATRPAFSWAQLWSGDFSQQCETYVNDQFPWRDGWITVKSVSESLLGKRENNGIVYGKDGHMFEKQLALDETFAQNTVLIQEFAKRQDKPVMFTMIPAASEILTDQYPSSLPKVDQLAQIEEVYAQFASHPQITCIPMHEALQQHAEEYIYYRTDHHWTSLGAYYGYTDFCRAMDFAPVSLEDEHMEEYPGFLGTYYAKSKKAMPVEDTIFWYNFPIRSMEFEGQTVTELYDRSQIETHDGYAAFLYGNHPLTTIRTEQTNGRSICIFKDSFTNSFVPYLTAHYETIYLIDLRYYNQNVKQWLDEAHPDDIYILYQFNNFATDPNFYRFIA